MLRGWRGTWHRAQARPWLARAAPGLQEPPCRLQEPALPAKAQRGLYPLRHLTLRQTPIDILHHLRQVIDGVDQVVRA